MERNEGKWFVLHALSGHEYKVRENIETALRQSDVKFPVYETVVPVEYVSEVKDGKKHTVKRKIYPGYVFARMDLYSPDGIMNEKLWFFMRGVQGVIGFIGGNDHPTPLSDSEAEDLCRCLDVVAGGTAQQAVKPPVDVGDAVRLVDGPFMGLQGTVIKIDAEHAKLEVQVSLFGRSTGVDADFGQVERDDTPLV